MPERPIFLTGATGYIGSRLLRELEAGGCTVRCLARQIAFAHRHRVVRTALGSAPARRALMGGRDCAGGRDGAAVGHRPSANAAAGSRGAVRRSGSLYGRLVRLILPVCLVVLFASGSASAQTSSPGRISISVEALNVRQQRNDVRIPPDTGTEFSLLDLFGSSPTPSLRVTATADVTEQQQVRFVYAPLRLTGQGTPTMPLAFAETTFAPVPTEAVYRFSSYRGTWSYRVYQGPTWTWRIGFTGFVRDARIALTQTDRSAEDTDVGVVPLGHVSANAQLSARWSAGFVLDGSAAPQGRAFDFAATLEYRPAPRWSMFGGYRTIEGGADVDIVYTFAWLNAAVAGIGVRF